MSDALAIAAVTATLRNLLFSGLNADVAGTSVTTRPPDKARTGMTGSQVNLFLFHMLPDSAWRNMDIPWRTKPGERVAPHLPLKLHYLLTAYYGENEEDIDTDDANRLNGSQRLLGRAVSLLLDHAILEPRTIHASLPPQDQLDSPFDSQENVRLTFQSMSLDEVTKLWSGFQTQYRLSAVFEASMVLVESRRQARTPLPVLTIGTNNNGVSVQTDVQSPLPAINAVRPANQQPSARLTERLTIEGHRLDADDIEVTFGPRLWTAPQAVAPESGGSSQAVAVSLPDQPQDWFAGVYTVSIVLTIAGRPERKTNVLPFSLAPEIVAVDPDPAPLDANRDVTLTISCRPDVRPGQTVSLLLGDRQITPRPFDAQTAALVFDVTDAEPGDHYLRLRIDGVDSLLVQHGADPPVFDPTQKVTITP